MRNPLGLFVEEIEKLRVDSVHGATYLTKASADAVARLALAGASRKELREAARRVAAARPMMASVFDFANSLLFFLDAQTEPQAVAEFCRRYIRETEERSEAAVVAAVEKLRGVRTIVTHSSSSLVRDTLIEAAKRGERFRLYCTESRPGGEGISLARTLCENGIDTTLVIDAAAGSLMERADLFLVGSDGIGVFGLVHKTGTYPMALAARERGAAFTVVTTTRKFWPSGIRKVEETPKEGDEITPERGCFEKLNRYFDITPLQKGDTVLTEEEGSFDGEEALKICEERPLHRALGGPGPIG